jgi:hypothetical protein
MEHPMVEAPRMIDGAKVICFTPIDLRHRATGNCRQIIAGVAQGQAAGLAVCQYEGEDGFYLFGCDVDWNCITDTWCPTLDEVLAQAEFEYVEVSKTWRKREE